MSQRLLHTKTNSRHVSTMHSSQQKLCARKTELALIMKFYLDFAMATNVHTKYIFPRCLDRERFGLSGQSIKGRGEPRGCSLVMKQRAFSGTEQEEEIHCDPRCPTKMGKLERFYSLTGDKSGKIVVFTSYDKAP